MIELGRNSQKGVKVQCDGLAREKINLSCTFGRSSDRLDPFVSMVGGFVCQTRCIVSADAGSDSGLVLVCVAPLFSSVFGCFRAFPSLLESSLVHLAIGLSWLRASFGRRSGSNQASNPNWRPISCHFVHRLKFATLMCLCAFNVSALLLGFNRVCLYYFT